MTTIAIIGFGYIAPFHLQAFHHLGEDIRVVVVSRSPENRDLAESAGAAATYAEVTTMLAEEQVAGMVVSVAISAVEAVSSHLLDHGIPLLIEKPPALSVRGAAGLADQARAKGVPVMAALNRRHYSVVGAALSAVGGRTGLRAVRVEAPERFASVKAAGVHPPKVLARWGYCNSIHGIDLLAYLLGETPTEVTAHRQPDPVLDHPSTLAQGRTTQGIPWQYASWWGSPGRWTVDLYGDDVRVTLAPLEAGVVHRRGEDPVALNIDPADLEDKPGFRAQAGAFLEGIGTGHFPAPAADLDQAVASMRFVQAIFGYPD